MLNAQSCADALTLLILAQDPATQKSWYNRTEILGTGMPLPQHYMSTDGTCFAAPEILPGQGYMARASVHDLARGVAAVITECVQISEHGHSGGAAKEISADKKMAIVLKGNRPNARCFGNMPGIVEPSCQTLLDSMDVSEESIMFGPMNDPSADVKLPYMKVSRDRRCAITIRSTDSRDTWSWYAAWAAAAELTAMCARTGKRGGSFNQGDNRRLFMDIGPPVAGVSSS